MPSDYKSRLDKKQSNKSLPGFIWLLSGLAIGLFVAFIVYLDKQPENDSDFGTAVQRELDQLKQKAQQSKATTTKATSKSGDPQKKEQKFNFYTLLPELEVLIPEDETRPPEAKSEKPKTVVQKENIKEGHRYILQVGSFQNHGDAEKLKASLALLGLHAEIQSVSINAQRWHRVRTGPYHSKNELFNNKKLLQENNINAISVELK